MLSRIARVGLQALARPRAGQNAVTSRSHEVEAIGSSSCRVGRDFCSSSNSTADDRNTEPDVKT
ncbi:hypothetical protein ACP70R_006344 [Stipagrostis hirtigluma subsp. patula]